MMLRANGDEIPIRGGVALGETGEKQMGSTLHGCWTLTEECLSN